MQGPQVEPLPSFAPLSTKVAPPQAGVITLQPVAVRQEIWEGFWRFWSRRNPIRELLDRAAIRLAPVSSYPLEYTPDEPSRIARTWNPSMGGNHGILARGYRQTWDSLPLPPRVVPLIMQGGKPSVIMGVANSGMPQSGFKYANNPQRIAPVYVRNV